MSELHAAAVRYARMGIPVFRLRPGTGVPFPRTNGFKDATTDIYQVKEWWHESPNANIGGLTGVVFSVLDIDSPEGWDNFYRMLDLPYFPEYIAVAHTTKRFERVTSEGKAFESSGAHIYIPPQPGTGRYTSKGGGFVPGIDALGDNGYVVMPPSVIDERHPDPKKTHGTYEWAPGCALNLEDQEL